MKKALTAILVFAIATAAAFVVDEIAYYRWRSRMAGVASQLEQSHPDSVSSALHRLPRDGSPLTKPDIAFVLFYQPPQLAWTYHASLHSKVGYRVQRAYLAFKRCLLPASVSAEFTTEHSPYVLGVRRCMPYDPCQPKGAWQAYVEHQVGSF